MGNKQSSELRTPINDAPIDDREESAGCCFGLFKTKKNLARKDTSPAKKDSPYRPIREESKLNLTEAKDIAGSIAGSLSSRLENADQDFQALSQSFQ